MKVPIIILVLLATSVVSIKFCENCYDDFIPEESSPCLRECKTNEPSMTCYYKFVVEWYQTLSRACYDCPNNTTDCLRPHCVAGNGVNKPIITVNRRIPGPGIQVCAGDKIVVDVENHLDGEGTTIHWHGLFQKKTPYMDGVPFVTQCPITSRTTFRYSFTAEQVGTNFWHSHAGLQRAEGMFGALITRLPKESEPHNLLYDYDLPSHVIVLTEWLDHTALSTFTNSYHSDGEIPIKSMLVNGLGYFMDTETKVGVPPARFTVKKNYRYRFRLINAGFLPCPIEISVDKHNITVISSDSYDVEPMEVESFISSSGERFDFILNADQDIDNYWIRFRGLQFCNEHKAHQVAVLNYEGSPKDGLPESDPSFTVDNSTGLQLNPVTLDMGKNTSVSIVELNSIYDDDIILKKVPDYQFYIDYDFYNITNTNFYYPGLYEYDPELPKNKMTTPQLNHITLNLQTFPLLTQRDSIKENMFCNETNVQNCTTEFCSCTHVMQVPLNSVVELIFVDTGLPNMNHPFHLHGNAFRVLGMETFNSSVSVEQIKEMDRHGLLQRKLTKAPFKDTVAAPGYGYTIVRFYTHNPGYWFFHCHIEYHAVMGMALVLKVGEHEDMVPTPDGFPQCGNWAEDI